MKVGVIFGLIGAACAVINSLLWIIRTMMMWGDAVFYETLPFISNIQTFILYPMQNVFLFTFFVMFLINIKKITK